MVDEGKVEKSSIDKALPVSRELQNFPHAPSTLNFRQNVEETTLQRGSYHLQKEQEAWEDGLPGPCIFLSVHSVLSSMGFPLTT